MKMNKAVQIRMPIEMWDHLSTLATKRAPGTKVTHLIREAIQRTFYSEGEAGQSHPSKGKSGGGGVNPSLSRSYRNIKTFPAAPKLEQATRDDKR
jgi:hypothetical protein